MKKALTWVTIVIVNCVSVSLAQHTETPYAGEEKREIKSLSIQEVQALLSGHGMGLAKAAELNRYPGPKHVLGLAEKLELSEQQIEQTQEIFDEMHQEATRIGRIYIEKENGLDRLFAEQAINEHRLHSLVLDLGKLRGELRFVHLKAHLKMKSILTPQQVAKYDELRGYGENKEHNGRHH